MFTFAPIASKKVKISDGNSGWSCFNMRLPAQQPAWNNSIYQYINNESDGTDIVMRWKMECSIQRGEANLNRTFHLSLNENICTIARMKYIHNLFYITSKFYFVTKNAKLILIYWKMQFCLDRAVSSQRSLKCTIAWYYLMIVKRWI